MWLEWIKDVVVAVSIVTALWVVLNAICESLYGLIRGWEARGRKRRAEFDRSWWQERKKKEIEK
jgi:hypothetical protein